MKKLKNLLKESNVWDRSFGESLPTLKDCEERFAKKQGKDVNEGEMDDTLNEGQYYMKMSKNAVTVEFPGDSHFKRGAKVPYYLFWLVNQHLKTLGKSTAKFKQ